MPQENVRVIAVEMLFIPVLMAIVTGLVVISTWAVDILIDAPWVELHRSGAIYGFSLVCTFLSLWLVLGAVYAYVNVGQAKKIEIITGFYAPNTIADYFDQFWSGRDGIRALVQGYRANPTDKNAADLEAKFRDLFRADFGLRVYIVPVVLLVSAGSIVLFFGYSGGIGLAAALSSGTASPVLPLGINLDLVSIAAIFGAYTWVASDVIVRNHQWTLHPSDLAWYALRLIIAIPLGHALALLVGGADITANTAAGAAGTIPPPLSGAGAFVAFVASMFSLDAITKALGKAATRFGVQMVSSDDERDDLIVRLAGVDEEKARALSVEGVSTIAQLVAVDPIRTSIRSGLPFEYILRLIDAAILWVFVGDKLTQLRPLGLRGASDVLDLYDDWNGPEASATALAAFQKARRAVDQTRQNAAQAQVPIIAAQAEQQPPAPAVATTAQQGAVPPDSPTPSGAADRTAMWAALSTKAADNGPELTSVGFSTIMDRLCEDGYAQFIRRLLL